MVTEREFYLGLVAAAPTLWQCGKHFFATLDVDHVHLIKENHIKTIYSDMDSNGKKNLSFVWGPLQPVFIIALAALISLDWLIDWILFWSPLRMLHLFGDVTLAEDQVSARRVGLWAGRDLYRATPAITRDLWFTRSHQKDPPPVLSPLTTADLNGKISLYE